MFFFVVYVEEDVDHILRGCPAASLLWSKLGVRNEEELYGLPLREWVLKNVDHINLTKGDNWPRVFVMTCWWLWRWRNERAFNAKPNFPINQCAFIMARVSAISRAMDTNEEHRCYGKRKRQEVMICWTHPRDGLVKLNTDGAAKGNPGLVGGGGLIRGYRGDS